MAAITLSAPGTIAACSNLQCAGRDSQCREFGEVRFKQNREHQARPAGQGQCCQRNRALKATTRRAGATRDPRCRHAGRCRAVPARSIPRASIHWCVSLAPLGGARDLRGGILGDTNANGGLADSSLMQINTSCYRAQAQKGQGLHSSTSLRACLGFALGGRTKWRLHLSLRPNYREQVR